MIGQTNLLLVRNHYSLRSNFAVVHPDEVKNARVFRLKHGRKVQVLVAEQFVMAALLSGPQLGARLVGSQTRI